jgi:hypothetical protein
MKALRFLVILPALVLPAFPQTNMPPTVPWENLRGVPMSGDLKVFWNVSGGDNEYNFRQATLHGFGLVTCLNTYADYPGKQKENISAFLKANAPNPWNKPDFFERIIKRNIANATNPVSIFVHDIEFDFEEDIDKACADPAAHAASGAKTKEEFSTAYFREWASWFALPCRWARELRPGLPTGLYGIQPFRRDYWGVAGKTAQQIDGTHRSDKELWQHVDPCVDFYVASVYIFYDKPDSVYYVAANIEENYQRTRCYGNKPVYAYEWMLYHSSNKQLAGLELAPYLVEAMAVVPYFSGGRGIVLWDSKPKIKGQYYQNLPVFIESLGRISDLSKQIAGAQLVIDEPAHVLWKEKRPLTRKLKVSDDEWIVLAVNPWQADTAQSAVPVQCGKQSFSLPLSGRHTGIFHIQGTSVKEVMPKRVP